MINCLIYIQNNPVKAKIVNRAEDYKYSSYNNYLNGNGIIDREEAKKIFDISPKSMKALMLEKSISGWLEHDDREYEDKEKVLEEIVERYKIDSKAFIQNDELLIKLIKEIQERSGASLREIASIIGIGRETLRIRLSIPPSP